MIAAELKQWAEQQDPTATVLLVISPTLRVVLDRRFLVAEATRLCDTHAAHRLEKQP